MRVLIEVGCAFAFLAGCASAPQDAGPKASPPADPLAAAVLNVCLPALGDMSKLRRLATQAGFDWIDVSDKERRPIAVANGVSVSQDGQGVCEITLSAIDAPGLQSFEAVWTRANDLAFRDGAPSRQTRAPNGNAALSCRDTPRRSLMVTMADGGALPETLDLAGQSFVRLGGEQRLADIRIFLIDGDCAAMDEGVKKSSVKAN